MSFRPFLTNDELRSISDRSPAGSDARRLLWEIRHYQAIALRFHQVMASLGPAPGVHACIMEVALAELGTVPAVQAKQLAGKLTLDPPGHAKRKASPVRPAAQDRDERIPRFDPPQPPDLKPKS